MSNSFRKAHIAVYVTNPSNPRVVTVIQPRNSIGQFLSPNANAAVSAATAHTSVNGTVTFKGGNR
jgi:hypothetical protein